MKPRRTVSVSSHSVEDPLRPDSMATPAAWLDALPDPAALCDANGRLLQANTALFDTYERATVHWADRMADLVFRDDREILTRAFDAVAAGAPRAEALTRLIEGTRWYLWRLSAYGQQVLLIGTDQTLVTALEQRLLEREHALVQFRDTLPGVMYRVEADAEGCAQFVSIYENAVDIMGYTLADFQRDPTLVVRHIFEDDRPMFYRATQEALHDGTTRDLNFRIVRKDGSVRWIRDVARPSFTPNGGYAWDGMAFDIHDLKTTEEALFAAKEEAEYANRTKTEFLANMSHELRTPLNAIIGFSELMLSEALGPIGNDRYKNYVNDISDSGQHLLSVINDILDMSKVEAGQYTLREQAVNLTEVVARTLETVTPLLADAGLMIRKRLDPNLPDLWADRRLIRQIVTNLISNAIKFTPEGTVAVAARRNSEGGLRLIIADSGIGMTPEQVSIATMPFGQVENSLNRTKPGTGLGLTLVHSFVSLHAGRVSVRSWPGKGTVVRIDFPPSRVVPSAASKVPDTSVGSVNS